MKQNFYDTFFISLLSIFFFDMNWYKGSGYVPLESEVTFEDGVRSVDRVFYWEIAILWACRANTSANSIAPNRRRIHSGLVQVRPVWICLFSFWESADDVLDLTFHDLLFVVVWVISSKIHSPWFGGSGHLIGPSLIFLVSYSQTIRAEIPNDSVIFQSPPGFGRGDSTDLLRHVLQVRPRLPPRRVDLCQQSINFLLVSLINLL